MPVESVRNIFRNERNNLAFIVGNGINRYNSKSNGISWEEILVQLWEKVYSNNISTIPNGISLTEFYDILELGIETGKIKLNLQKEFCELLGCLKYSNHHKCIVNSIKNMNAPLLTTNFENTLAESIGLNFYKTKAKDFTDFYPWECYYGEKQMTIPTDTFGIWHINGMQKYHRSIRLGLTHYMGSVERARNLIHKGVENTLYRGKNENDWKGHKTWLHIIFNKSLVIFGINLEENEVFLRWLLIERAKYFKIFPNRTYKAWYITQHNSCSSGKILFFQSLGIKIIEVNNYRDIYENIW